MKNHKPWIITAKSSDTIEIFLYEMIGEDWLGEGTTAKSFAEDLRAAGKISTIHLRVNSPGGNVFDGISMYNTLLSHGAKVTAAVDGLAASIASVIIMAASEISMNDNAMMMVHNPSTMIGGDAPRMRKMAETLDKIKSSMITAYRRHSSKSVEEIGALLDAETWMTAQETVDNGFAESVTIPNEDEAADLAANFDLSHFRKVPAKIAAVFGRHARGSTSRAPLTDAQRRARTREREIELASWNKEPLTDAQRRARTRQRAIELDALGRKVRAATVRQMKADLASLSMIIESEESRKPKTDAQRAAVMRKHAIELGKKPYLSAQRRYPGMS